MLIARLTQKATALVVWLEDPKRHQLWRVVRLAAAGAAATGVVDQLVHGTATRASLEVAAVAAIEAVYRALYPAKV